MPAYFVYILKCQTDHYYVGFTADLSKRLARHKTGNGSKFTRDSKVDELLYYETFADKMKALDRERQLKGWSRAKKEALISGNFRQLKRLSGSRSTLKNP
jgi:predicted GIY-YIG superfamily endonuclease